MSTQIDRSNYEVWLIDWLDGNLSEDQVKELELFLSAHPDLKDEFEELSAVSLIPSSNTYPNKSQLIKSAGDITDSQFEYLCVSYLENDIESSQKQELMELIEQYPEKKRTFELIQKTKLKPAYNSYKHKRKLIKTTPAQKIFRLSALAMSSAAAILIILITFIKTPPQLPSATVITARNIPDETKETEATLPEETEIPVVIINSSTKTRISNELLASMHEPASVITSPDLASQPSNEVLVRSDEHFLEKISVNISNDIISYSLDNNLIAYNSSSVVPVFYDDRGNISRFISKTFRERILKEDIYQNTPLKGYEIAEAGVSGLNKLLGWEMALDENRDENGELRSVYFSSKILKFNAPVKKSEPTE